MKCRYVIALGLPMLLAGCAPEPADEPPPPETSDAPPAEAARAIPDPGPPQQLIFRPDEIEWKDPPPSLEPGAQVALLEGNPGEAGYFTMRIRMPDGYHISPHWHPNVERVTVISGTFLLGAGDTLDAESANAFEAGSYTSMPPEMRHFAIAEGDTVVQLTSIGPWEINYINPDDDPRLRD
jgi:quercetin dioxygenase-like cupin family protein